MTKIANGRSIKVALAAGDQVGGLKLIGTKMCRIVSKDRSGTSGVVALDGVVKGPKQAGSAWAQFEEIYWDTTNSRFTDASSGNTLAGVAHAPAASGATEGEVLLNGNAAIHAE